MSFLKVFSHWFYFPFLQNTFTNAERLLKDAAQLAQTGECEPDEIEPVARALELKVHDFVSRVAQRRQLLVMSVAFHQHSKEVCWISDSTLFILRLSEQYM